MGKQCEETFAHERANMHKALRKYEREHSALKDKVEDLWKQLPLTEGLLEQSKGRGGGHNGRTLKPLNDLIEVALNKSLDHLREDLLHNLSEVQGQLGSKASADELIVLQDRVNRWARNHMPQSPSNGSVA